MAVGVMAMKQTCAQYKTISVKMPPEIMLVPLPKRVVVFGDREPVRVARDKKEKLITECTDSFLVAFVRNAEELLPEVEFLLYAPAKGEDSLNQIAALINHYHADLALGIASFRPGVEQGDVTVERDEDGSKNRTARYYMAAGGTLNIYTKDTLVRSFLFSQSQFLSDRAVVSGLFAAGPSLVKNRKAAVGVSVLAAGDLARKFVPQTISFQAALFTLSELKDVTDLIRREDYDAALSGALALTSNNKTTVSARAHYYCALVYHQRGQLQEAFDHIAKANETRDLQRVFDYYSFLKKYVVDNVVGWQ